MVGTKVAPLEIQGEGKIKEKDELSGRAQEGPLPRTYETKMKLKTMLVGLFVAYVLQNSIVPIFFSGDKPLITHMGVKCALIAGCYIGGFCATIAVNYDYKRKKIMRDVWPLP